MCKSRCLLELFVLLLRCSRCVAKQYAGQQLIYKNDDKAAFAFTSANKILVVRIQNDEAVAAAIDTL